jgi:hypothetical protein
MWPLGADCSQLRVIEVSLQLQPRREPLRIGHRGSSPGLSRFSLKKDGLALTSPTGGNHPSIRHKSESL